MEEISIDNIMNLIHKAEDTFLRNGLTVSPSVYKEIQKVVDENKRYKQQIDELKHKIQLLQMDGKVEVKDLLTLLQILKERD